jgi:hypothetical protein
LHRFPFMLVIEWLLQELPLTTEPDVLLFA